MKAVYWKSAIELGRLIRRGEISPVEVINAFLTRIEMINPKINAINTLVAEKAMAVAKEAESSLYRSDAAPGLLHGVPLLVKDNVFTRGIKTTFGSLLYENFVPAEDAVLVARLKDAGAIVTGKTNLPEYGMVPVTDNLLFGATFNPWDPAKTCGGSSGGSAAAVAAGLGPIATGNDAGGSIRIPASLCGVYGLKPSFGRIPRYPRFSGMETIAHEGPITRTVSDAALMLDIMSGPDDRDRYSLPFPKGNFLKQLKDSVKGIKIAFNMDLGYVVASREVKELVRQAVSVFSEMGAVLEEVDIELLNMEKDLRIMATSELITANEGRLEEWKSKAHPFNLPLFSMADRFTSRDIVRIQFRREELWDKVRLLFEKYDLLLTPASPVAAFDITEGVGPDQIDGWPVKRMSWLGFTLPFNFTGQPAASVPCGFTGKGLPVGLQIIGRRFDDQAVLNASAAFEKARPWQGNKPPLAWRADHLA